MAESSVGFYFSRHSGSSQNIKLTYLRAWAVLLRAPVPNHGWLFFYQGLWDTCLAVVCIPEECNHGAGTRLAVRVLSGGVG